jgi:peptide/nickel transport system ATP-binding protein
VAEPLEIHAVGAPADRKERALALLETVGLQASFAGRYPHELSGGQRQRVVLARALILDPSLIVADEPVSALDVSIQAQVLNLFEDLQARFGMAFLFISHDLKVVRQVAHEVAVMYLGRIVEQGPPEALFSDPAHPYTRALVSAIPVVRRRAGAARIVLEGDPPNPIAVPQGCAFHPRCPSAVSTCRMEAPALKPLGDGRLVACHVAHGDAALPKAA